MLTVRSRAAQTVALKHKNGRKKRQISTTSAHFKRKQEKAAPYGCVRPRRSSSKRSKRWKVMSKSLYLVPARDLVQRQLGDRGDDRGARGGPADPRVLSHRACANVGDVDLDDEPSVWRPVVAPVPLKGEKWRKRP